MHVYHNSAVSVLSANFSLQGIWHMGIIMEAMTTPSLEEKLHLIRTLVATTGGKGVLHEAFDPDRPAKFTRPWFSWTNSLFAELVRSVTDECK